MSRTKSLRNHGEADRLWADLKREIDQRGTVEAPRSLSAAIVDDLEELASESGIAVTHRPGGGLVFTRLWEQET